MVACKDFLSGAGFNSKLALRLRPRMVGAGTDGYGYKKYTLYPRVHTRLTELCTARVQPNVVESAEEWPYGTVFY
jgi:hypothetical protein